MNSLFKTYLHLLLYLILFNACIISITISLHELGHLSLGNYLECKGKAVLFDLNNFNTYTELSCPEYVSSEILAYGAFIFVLPFALAFLLLKEFPEKNFCWIIIGLGIVTGSLDIVEIFKIPSAYYFSLIFGIILICFGEFSLSDSILERIETKKFKLPE